MNTRTLLNDQAHRLVFLLDPLHPQDVRSTLEAWIKPLRGATLGVWGEKVPVGKLALCLPSPAWEKPKRFQGHAVFVRPIHQDLLSFSDTSLIEEQVDAVLEAHEGETPFYMVVAGLLSRAMAREGESARKMALKYSRQFERQLKNAIAELSEDPALHTLYLENFERFLDLQEELAGAPGVETLTQNLELLARRLDRKKNWRLHFSGAPASEGAGQLFYLGRLQGAPVFLENLAQLESTLDITAAALIAASLTKIVKRWESDQSDIKPGQMVQEAFQALPFPMLLLGGKGEVLQHNTAFVKLNLTPSRVHKLQDIDQVQLKEQSWTVRRTMLSGSQDSRLLFTFLPEKMKGMSTDSTMGGQDLGIITSSIAHELNNPIAGLLVALEMLSMEDFWDDEAREQLNEMRQGTLRCKQLVETFLGFSRMKPMDGEVRDKDLLKNCFEQALNLQRFRMVESGLRVNISHKQKHPFAYSLHAPTATMLAYLVIGDIMTAFHHLKLLERRSARGLVLEAEVFEDADRFQIVLRPQIALKQGLSSKLLHYLLQQEKLQLEVGAEGELMFIHQNVLI